MSLTSIVYQKTGVHDTPIRMSKIKKYSNTKFWHFVAQLGREVLYKKAEH